jgi:hypothetical protein
MKPACPHRPTKPLTKPFLRHTLNIGLFNLFSLCKSMRNLKERMELIANTQTN